MVEEKIIKAVNLSRNFKQYKKDPGLRGSIKGLFKRVEYEVTAVKDVSFDVSRGEMVGFIGPNGAGKTTTLKMLFWVIVSKWWNSPSFGT